VQGGVYCLVDIAISHYSFIKQLQHAAMVNALNNAQNLHIKKHSILHHFIQTLITWPSLVLFQQICCHCIPYTLANAMVLKILSLDKGKM